MQLSRHGAITAVAIAGEMAWIAYVLGRGSDAGLSVFVLIMLVWGGAALLLFWLIRLAVHFIARGKEPRSSYFIRWLIEPLVLGASFIAVWSGVAFQTRFFFSKPALQQFASAPHVVNPSPSGPWVGLFHIREAEVLPQGVVRIITTDCMFDDCGLVYAPEGAPPVVGEDSYTPLGGGWWQWLRSW